MGITDSEQLEGVSVESKNLLAEIQRKIGVSPEDWNRMATEEKSLARLWGVYLLYGDVLKKADPGDMRSLVSDLGYKSQLVEMGFRFRDPFQEETEIQIQNSVRMGEEKTLYIGAQNGKYIYNFEELSHDLGAILLGYWDYEKMPDPEEWEKDHIVDMDFIRAKGSAADTSGLDKIENDLALGLGQIFSNETRMVVSTTHLLDALMLDILDPKVIELATSAVIPNRH